MRKKVINKGYYVNIVFNKKNITQITSNVFGKINTTVENKNNMCRKDFEKRAFREMKNKTIKRKKKAEQGQNKRRIIFEKLKNTPVAD